MENFSENDIEKSKSLVGIVSIIGEPHYSVVKSVWKDLEKNFGLKKVQTFPHPHVTFQGGLTGNTKKLITGFKNFRKNLKAYRLITEGLDSFGNNVIFIKIKKTDVLKRLNSRINTFLHDYCEEMVDQYNEDNWVPHITLAVDDIPEKKFKIITKSIMNYPIKFQQIINNYSLVKLLPSGKIKILQD